MAWLSIHPLSVLRVKYLRQICELFALNVDGRKNFWRLKLGCTERSLPIVNVGRATFHWTISKKLRGLSMYPWQSYFCRNSTSNQVSVFLPLCAAESRRLVRGCRRGLIKQLAIRLSWQTTPAKSLVMFERVARVPQPPGQSSNAGNPAGAANRGRLFF